MRESGESQTQFSQSEMSTKLEGLENQRKELLAKNGSQDEVINVSAEIGRLRALLLTDEGLQGIEVDDKDIVGTAHIIGDTDIEELDKAM